jgi:hypothetical protein
MVIAGILVTLAGCLISILSIGFASGVAPRMIMVLAGIAVSLFGILKLINGAYLQNAIWKRGN